MFYALSWLVVVFLLALWSLAAWALHAVAVWAVSNAGTLSAASGGFGGIALPDWLAPWIPAGLAQAMNQWMAGLGPLVDSLLQTVPALAGALTVVAWGIWGVGVTLLLLVGTALHVMIALWRRRGKGGPGPDAGRPLATG